MMSVSSLSTKSLEFPQIPMDKIFELKKFTLLLVDLCTCSKKKKKAKLKFK